MPMQTKTIDLREGLIAIVTGPGPDSNCPYCGGRGERYWHTERCFNDDCALAAGIGDCRGEVEECPCVSDYSSQPQSGEPIDPDDESNPPCWCGEENPLFDDDFLDARCGGSGTLYCYCGGDQCICHNHGEVECFGCADCDLEDGSGDDGDWDDGFDSDGYQPEHMG